MQPRDYSFLPFLFNETIYVVPEDKPANQVEKLMAEEKETQPDNQLTWQGNNLQQVIILIKYPDNQYLDENQRGLLGKILSAVKLTFDDIALINLAHYPDKLSLDQVTEPGAKYLLAFGITPDDIDSDRNLILQEIFTRNRTQLLFTASLEDLEKDRNKKVSLWNNLKQMFRV